MGMFFELGGQAISEAQLQIVKARELVEALHIQNYVSLVQCIKKSTGEEVVVFDAEVEVPQKRVHDIRSVERIAVKFDPEDKTLPDTLALRTDFPKVSHLNIRDEEFPRSLCLFEAPYSEIKLRWTAAFYIKNVRNWLALTARGELHAEDQPLEPLLYGSEGFLILPPAILDQENPVQVLAINQTIEHAAQKTYLAKVAESLNTKPGETKLLITTLCADPQTHGLIHSKPKNLVELHDFLAPVGLNLIDHVQQQLQHWNKDEAFDAVKNAKLIILLLLPKMRSDADDTSETIELSAFVTEKSIVEIGKEVGIWDVFEGEVGPFLSIDSDKNGKNVQLEMLNPLLDFSTKQAALMNGRDDETDIQIALVGVGALGSQVFLNLLRMGYGCWKLIDHDILLPHNLARHALTREFVGVPKAIGLAILASRMVNDPTIVEPHVENVLLPSASGVLEPVFRDAQVILDISTSIAVARKLTHEVDSTARRISLFLNPTATDIVILAEDNYREIKLDVLEMQYYRELVSNTELHEHLGRGEDKVRYGTSCRDLSSRISQDLVALHSAVTSHALRQTIDDQNAAITIWKANPADMTTQQYSVQVGQEKRIVIGGWTIITDSQFLKKIAQIRESKLPNETGGILIGSYDLVRKIVYVVDTIPAPPDSIEWPTVFIRGSKGLKQQVKQIQTITDNQLDYIGEWHSHPVGAGGRPSRDDIKAFEWLRELMANDGLPALAIIATDGESHFYLGKMKDYADDPNVA